MTPAGRIAEREAENAALREQMQVLAAQVQQVQARLAKDSHNSSKPPSSDGRARTPRRTKSLRTPCGKKAGGPRGRLAQSPARHLLERLLLDQEAGLAFLDDLAIPFDNNQAERDLRGFNVHQKVSNGFRSDPGAAAFARIRGYLATLCKQGHALLAALETVVAGRPFYPAFA